MDFVFYVHSFFVGLFVCLYKHNGFIMTPDLVPTVEGGFNEGAEIGVSFYACAVIQ